MLVADVPLGAFVSGGVDSGLIAAMMTDLTRRPDRHVQHRLRRRRRGERAREAARVAAHIGSRHHALMLSPDHVLDAFDRWVDVFDEPFADQAALPTMLLSGFARRDVTVVLTGEGADEVFGGYSNYRKRVREERLTRWLGASGVAAAGAGARRCRVALRKDRLLRSLAEPLARRYRTIPNMFDVAAASGAASRRAFLAATRGAPDVGDCAAARVRGSAKSRAYLDRLLHVDTRLWLPDDLLTKVDRATMAHSLEARVPYLDHGSSSSARGSIPAQKIRGDDAQAHPEARRRALPAGRHRASRQAGLRDAAVRVARRTPAGRARRASGRAAGSRGAACSATARSRACWPSIVAAAAITPGGCGRC